MAKQKISTQKAITIGQLFINLPVFIIISIVMIYLWLLDESGQSLFGLGPVSYVFAPLVAWVYWSFSITKWRIWAYKKVSKYP